MSSKFPRAHPEIRPILENAKPVPWDNIQQCREMAKAGEKPNPLSESVNVYDKFIDSDAGPNALRLLVFEPKAGTNSNNKTRPCLLWAHPGGLANRRPECDMVMLATLAEKGIVCLSIDYRRTPDEAKYPGPLDDVRSAYKWLTLDAGASTLNCSAECVVIGGASAGSMLMASLAHHLTHPKSSPEESGPISLESAPVPRLVILESPMLAFSAHTLTADHPLGSYMSLSLEDIDILREYLLFDSKKGRGIIDDKAVGDRNARPNDHQLPIDIIPCLRNKEDFRNLPPHYISIHELDSLREQGILYADKLREANVSVESHFWRGTTHTHSVANPFSSPAKQLFEELAAQIFTHSL